jgi:hypothetical protein
MYGNRPERRLPHLVREPLKTGGAAPMPYVGGHGGALLVREQDITVAALGGARPATEAALHRVRVGARPGGQMPQSQSESAHEVLP